MKKIFTIIGISFLSVSSLQAQTPVEQGNFIIDVYAGIPNWANSILYNNTEHSDAQSDVRNYKLNGGLLSYGGRFEYMIADNFGVGVDVNYEVSGFNYDYTTQEYNDVTMQFENRDYNIDYKSKKLRAMARLNYHFVQNDRLDAYAGFAGGYKNVNRSFATNDKL